eukprot:CAMPEP_0197519116 /NCGR_PEP_ID=MMETSP1318-20131121/4381_1 /TAXON_ID=552666 /ORGANISM="Partenskyella glossopodia, Strain RCC365" /LENGTH=395 /DNA_ID=CAMNT_0043069915 /DNA_START=24 /DNA_END=1208 /DNA_ORIENTATION=+
MADLIQGFAASGMASLMFALMYVPVKFYPTYDGITFQWFMCSGVWISGFILHLAMGYDGLDRTVMIQGIVGGSMWAFANYLVVPVMQLIGLGLGFASFNVANLVVGYFVGRFGLFGCAVDPATYLGDAGLAVLVMSFIFMLNVTTDTDKSSNKDSAESAKALLDTSGKERDEEADAAVDETSSTTQTRLKHPNYRSTADSATSYSPMNRSRSPGVRRRKNFRRQSSLLFGAMPGAVASIGELPEQEDFNKTFTSTDLKNMNTNLLADSSNPWQTPPVLGDSKNQPSIIKEEEAADPPPKEPATPSEADEACWKRPLGFVLAIVSGLLMGTNLIPFLHWQEANPTLHPWEFVSAQTTGVYFMSTIIYLFYSLYARLSKRKVPHSGIRPAFFSGVIW